MTTIPEARLIEALKVMTRYSDYIYPACHTIEMTVADFIHIYRLLIDLTPDNPEEKEG